MSKPKAKTHTLSNSRINSQKIVIKTEAILLEDFMNNPVMLKDHVRGALNIIGRWINVRVEADQLLADPEFDLGCADGKEVARRVEAGFLIGISVGGEILEAHWVELGDDCYLEVTKFHLKEVSFVDVPSNKTCLVLYDKEMNVLTDWTFSDFPAATQSITKTQKNMDLKKIANQLGLSDTATEAEILEALKEQRQQVSNFADFQKQQKESQKSEIVGLLDKAITDGTMTDPSLKDSYIKLADADYDTVKKTIQSWVKPVTSLSAIARGAAAGASGKTPVTATFADLEKNNPAELERIYRENPAEFSKLYQAQFGISLADDIARVSSKPE